MDEAERIVRALAALDLPRDPEWGDCPLCKDRPDALNSVLHYDDCPWRMAREWADANPVAPA